MSYKTWINPILYNRLSFALADINRALDVEVEFVSRHLSYVEREFADNWDELPVRPTTKVVDQRVRWVFGQFTSIPAVFAVEGRINDRNVIEIRNIRIVPDPG